MATKLIAKNFLRFVSRQVSHDIIDSSGKVDEFFIVENENPFPVCEGALMHIAGERH